MTTTVHAPLNVDTVLHLGQLAETVLAGQPITWLDGDRTEHWGIARAFTHDGGGFLGGMDDIRDGFVWISVGDSLFERWIPVATLLEGMRWGLVALNSRP